MSVSSSKPNLDLIKPLFQEIKKFPLPKELYCHKAAEANQDNKQYETWTIFSNSRLFFISDVTFVEHSKFKFNREADTATMRDWDVIWEFFIFVI